MKNILISVVSHSQKELIRSLLSDIEDIKNITDLAITVIVTENIEEGLQTLILPEHNLRTNLQPRGFGQNHNLAFESVASEVFIIINPDVRIPKLDGLIKFVRSLEGSEKLVASPCIATSDGDVTDFYRYPLTFFNLLRRRFGMQEKGMQTWFSGAFLVIPSAFYRQLGGFDENYYMYVEDCDLCMRAIHADGNLEVIDDFLVHHDAQRSSHHSLKPFRMHVSSILYFWRKTIRQKLGLA